MNIITISRGSYSRGKEIAEKVARKLDYECIARDVLIETSHQFNIPEFKLVRAIHDAPSLLERFGHDREKYLSYFEAAFLRRMQNGNVVYHGLAGHFFLRQIPHVLKVRIIADMEERIQFEIEREGISREEALSMLEKDDDQRRKWSEYLFGIDTRDPGLYDVVIHIKSRKITTDLATDIICHAAQSEQFRATAESKRAMDDLVLAAMVKAALISMGASADVTSVDGNLKILLKGHLPPGSSAYREIERAAKSFPEVGDVQIKTAALADYT